MQMPMRRLLLIHIVVELDVVAKGESIVAVLGVQGDDLGVDLAVADATVRVVRGRNTAAATTLFILLLFLRTMTGASRVTADATDRSLIVFRIGHVRRSVAAIQMKEREDGE